VTVHSITLELPDKVYQYLKQRSQKTNRSLEEELLTVFALDLPVLPLAETEEYQAYNEVLEFLSSGPSPSAIVQFQLSAEARERAQALLAKEKTQGITAIESKELDFYVELGDFLGLLRAKAMLHLQHKAGS
jgi:hypothetical protein